MAVGAVGDTTTTDPRSRRNRAGRRGGQLLTRARGSSNGSACPRFVLPAPRSPDGHTIREDHAIPTGCSSATSIMPVTNALDPGLNVQPPGGDATFGDAVGHRTGSG